MRDLSREILDFSRKFQFKCPVYKGDGQCGRDGGCACAKFGEIYALVYDLIKPEYRKANFYSYNGCHPNGSSLVDTKIAAKIRKSLRTYLYGGARIPEGLTRTELNALSVLDERFKTGANLVVYGSGQQSSKRGGMYVKKHTPMGKTLIASIVLIDAIYRRSFPANKAMTYDWISFLQLRQMLKTKEDESLIETQEADWLVIDDLNIIDTGNRSKADAWTKETFDSFLIERLEARKPTILVCNFDITTGSLEEKMGSAFEKLVLLDNTHLVRVQNEVEGGGGDEG